MTFSTLAEVDFRQALPRPFRLIMLPLSAMHKVFKNAISAFLSSDDRSKLNSWPFTARVSVPGGPFLPVGT